jgi:hypothetical protein
MELEKGYKGGKKCAWMWQSAKTKPADFKSFHPLPIDAPNLQWLDLGFFNLMMI